MESIKKYFENGTREVFDPTVIYTGDWQFLIDALDDAGIIKDNKNLYKEYVKGIKNELKRRLCPLYNSVTMPLLLESNLVDNRRILKVSGRFCLEMMLEEISMHEVKFAEDNETFFSQMRDYLRDLRKCLNRFKKGEVKEEEKELYESYKKHYLVNEEYRRKALKFYTRATFANYLDAIISSINYLLVNRDYIREFFDKEVDTHKLDEILDIDKFALIMAKQLIEVTKVACGINNHIHDSFTYVCRYVYMVKGLRENGKYNLSCHTTLLDGKRVRISVDSVLNEYKELMVKHPEFEVYKVMPDPKVDYHNLEQVTEIAKELKHQEEAKKLLASWEFVKPGEKDSKEVITHLETKSSKKEMTRSEAFQAIYDRMAYLDSTPYLYKMTGKNNFLGYIGYLYENGCVIFERYYRDSGIEPSLSNATYVMNFNNFVRMSMLNKQDIINYIRDGHTDIRRVYHTCSWPKRLNAIILGKSYSKDVMDRIDSLINDGTFKKMLK